MAEKPFKVVIIGGSVAGLALANMLQINDIDFVILEAYPKIAPQVGASIGVLSNGNRILDQLGLFEAIEALAPPVERFNFRNSKGERIAGHGGMRHSFIQRHGYPITFLDRQMVLQVLYDNIKDKSKVLTEKRLEKIDLDEKGVTATMKDGSVFTGDMLVGGDGVHSTVRSEMWRLAEEKVPGYIPSGEHNAVPVDYSCIFGISNPIPGLEPGNLHSVFREKSSYLINGGPASRVYWFYLFKLPQRVYGSDIPNYTKEDEARILKEHENDQITPEITFGDLQARKICSTLTPLHEYVYKKWHYDRIFTCGDSVHKMNPIGGHGGNMAMETAAALTNALVKALKTKPKLSTQELTTIFSDVQKLRESRVTVLKDVSHEQQRTEAMEDAMHKFIAQTMLPMADSEDVLFNFSGNMPGADKLDMVELPPRPKLIPFKDELATPPTLRGPIGWLQMLFYLGCAAFAHYGSKSTNDALTDSDNKFGPPQMYFMGALIPTLSIWLIEACRKRNDMNLVAMPTIWFALSQYAGFGVIMPFFYTAYTLFSNGEPYWWPLGRLVPAHYVRVLLPCILIGYVLPTILLFIPLSDASLLPTLEKLWYASPMIASGLTFLSGMIYKKINPPPTATPFASEQPKDIPYLTTIYIITFLFGVAFHVSSFPSILELASTPTLALLTQNANLSAFYIASYMWCVNAVWDIKRVGRTTASVGVAAVMLAVANVLVGPGAAMVGCWYWREGAMAKTSVAAKKK